MLDSDLFQLQVQYYNEAWSHSVLHTDADRDVFMCLMHLSEMQIDSDKVADSVSLFMWFEVL